jgi:hypothetical protein
VKDVERELAGQRRRLEAEHAGDLPTVDPPPTPPDERPPTDPEPHAWQTAPW